MLFNLALIVIICFASLPFPVKDHDKEGGGGGDEDSTSPGHPGTGKGLSREQKNSLDIMKHIMLNLDEDAGLEEIYTFRSENFYLTLHDNFCL